MDDETLLNFTTASFSLR